MGKETKPKKETEKAEVMETKHKNLASAVIAVMKDVKGMEKNSKVGSGQNSYDGTKDMDVKDVFNTALAKHGLCVLPITIDVNSQVFRWQEENNYGGKKVIKQKQQVFTEVNNQYKLIHAESGEYEILAGLGHGVDPQDKGSGKACTYAMKNMLLYAFVTPVGKIDDTDNTHSEDIEQAKILQNDIINAVANIENASTEEDFNKACKAAGDLKSYMQVVEAAKKKKAELDAAKAEEPTKPEDATQEKPAKKEKAKTAKKKPTKAEVIKAGVKAIGDVETEKALEDMWKRLEKYQEEDAVSRAYEAKKASFNQKESA